MAIDAVSRGDERAHARAGAPHRASRGGRLMASDARGNEKLVRALARRIARGAV
jgi:hypothetical protein